MRVVLPGPGSLNMMHVGARSQISTRLTSTPSPRRVLSTRDPNGSRPSRLTQHTEWPSRAKPIAQFDSAPSVWPGVVITEVELLRP
jgi:hypothetical protein